MAVARALVFHKHSFFLHIDLKNAVSYMSFITSSSLADTFCSHTADHFPMK